LSSTHEVAIDAQPSNLHLCPTSNAPAASKFLASQ